MHTTTPETHGAAQATPSSNDRSTITVKTVGLRFKRGGFGDYGFINHSEESRFVLMIEDGGQKVGVVIEGSSFRWRGLPCFSRKIRELIEAEKPQEVRVEKRKTTYYVNNKPEYDYGLGEAELDEWAARVLARRKSRKTL